MNEDDKKKMVEGFKQSHTAEETKRVITDVALQIKALNVLRRKFCRKCQSKVYKTAITGQRFNRLELCQFCGMIYDRHNKEVE